MRVPVRILATAVFVAAAGAAFAEQAKPDEKTLQLGMKLYADQKCSMCHSIAGKGNQKGPLDEVGSKLSEEEIRQWLIEPRVMAEKTKATRKPVMPAYTKLSKEDLQALVAYMQSLKKK
jgi:mono/diheme cytochrome c family protein